MTPDSGTLGCGDYRVAVTGVGGAPGPGVLEGEVALEWNRRLDDVSEAVVTVAVGGSPECCGVLAEVAEWCHELAILRDGALVWSGPVIRVQYGRNAVVITARDTSAWLDRRVLRAPDVLSNELDLTDVAVDLLRPFVAELDLELDARPSGVRGDRKGEPLGGYVGDSLRELARTGLDYTVLGRRVVLFGAEPLGGIGPLTDEDFAGELTVTREGLAAATDVTVKGAGVVGRARIVDPPCLPVEVLVSTESITTQLAADELARLILAGSFPTPVSLEVPQGATLSQDAPVTIDELVPGVMVRVFSDVTCINLNVDLQLVELSVSVTSEGGERVGVNLAPRLSTDGGLRVRPGQERPLTVERFLSLLDERVRKLEQRRTVIVGQWQLEAVGDRLVARHLLSDTVVELARPD